MPKISIIVAVYNVEPYLKRSLDSLMNQTMEDLEFICVDDCSTDKSLEILKEYEAKDTRFKIITSQVNGGAAVARNKGLDVAQGEYLSFVDPDDALEEKFCEKLYSIAKKTHADIIKGSIKTFNLDGTIQESRLNKSIRKNKYAFINRWTTAIYKHSIIKENNIRFPEECRKGQDVVFLNRVLLKSKTIELVDDVYYLNYKRKGSLNAAIIPIESIKSAIKAVKLRYDDLNNSNLYEEDKKSYAYAYSKRMKMLFNTFYQNNTKEAQELCANAIIDDYFYCKAMDELDNVFLYPPLCKVIKEKDIKQLIKIMSKYKNANELYKINNKIKSKLKLFSIDTSVKNRKTHKIITFLGLKFKFKIKEGNNA